jgi:hypothetical protein
MDHRMAQYVLELGILLPDSFAPVAGHVQAGR